MKIREVCERTGLTDRAVRYYISEGLIKPLYTENYMGRKNFEFCDADVKALERIAVFRKFDFSVSEIRTMREKPAEIVPTVKALEERKRENVREQEHLIAALSCVDSARSWTVEELAKVLSEPMNAIRLPEKTEERSFWEWVKEAAKTALIALTTWLPVLFLLWGMWAEWREYEYPKIAWRHVLFSLRHLIPTALILLLPKFRWSAQTKRILRNILLVLCVIALFAIGFDLLFVDLAVDRSETKYTGHYRRLDISCPVYWDGIYQELFPLNPKRSEIREYYYRYRVGWDWTCDVYAELVLKQAEYPSEAERVRELFTNIESGSIYTVEPLRTERYEGWILYWGETPFEPVTDSYVYVLFAYDVQAQTARYIYCDSSENGVDQPYYLELDW